MTSDAPPPLTQREFFAAFAAALGSRTRVIPIPVGLARVVMGVLTSRTLARAAASFVIGENPYADDRARSELGWQPPYTAQEAVGRTVRWFVENEKPGR